MFYKQSCEHKKFKHTKGFSRDSKTINKGGGVIINFHVIFS